MPEDEGYEADAGESSDMGETSDIEQEDASGARKVKPTKLSAFLAMVLSGILSLTIATIMFMIGVLWGYREDARELRGLLQFFAVEVVETYAETAEAAEMKLVHGVSLDRSAPHMVSAVSLSRANALRVDPTLMATIRSFYGRRSRIARNLEAFKKGGKWHQMTAVIEECKAMGGEVRHVLEVAAGEGVGDEALKPLQESLKIAVDRIDSIVAAKKDQFPAVWATDRVSSIALRIGETTKRNFLVRNWSPDRPLEIKGLTASLDYVKPLLPEKTTVEPLGELKIHFEVSPKGPDHGSFEGTIIVETDSPGFEKVTVTVSGIVKPTR